MTMGFVEEKKENDSLHGANIHSGSGSSYDAEIEKDDHEKIKTHSFDMEENEGGGQQEEEPHGNNLVNPAQVQNMSMSNSGLLDQAAHAAQQLLAQTCITQQNQIHQLAQQPGIALDTSALSMLPQHSLGILTQSPTNSIPGSLNLLAVQNALVQNHNQAVAQAQASSLIGGGGMAVPSLVQPANGFVGNVVPSVASNGFTFGQQLPNQQQQQQQQQMQQAQQLGSSGSSISSTGLPTAFSNTQQVANALSPTNQVAPTTVMPHQLLSAVPFAAPSIFGPALPPASLTLSPQLTIPHYIPPTPASWGAPLPTLTVQDRPLVPPIYNGINPNYPKAQMLHAHPPIFCVHEFLTPAECDFLIEAASDAFGPAPVVGKGQGEVSPSRTSSTCYLAREDLPEVSCFFEDTG